MYIFYIYIYICIYFKNIWEIDLEIFCACCDLFYNTASCPLFLFNLSVEASAGEEVQKTLAKREKRGRMVEKKTHIISSRT